MQGRKVAGSSKQATVGDSGVTLQILEWTTPCFKMCISSVLTSSCSSIKLHCVIGIL